MIHALMITVKFAAVACYYLTENHYLKFKAFKIMNFNSQM